jgi:hypothetical protein
MVDVVELSFVKQALRIAERDGNDQILPHEDDTILQGYIDTATEAVLRYLKVDGSGWDVANAPASVRQAVVLAVQSMYDPDRVDLLSGLGTSDPKNPIVAMLCMMRDPTVA